MSKARIETYGSTVDLLGVDTDGALKKIARSVLATGVGEALGITAGVWTPTYSGETGVTGTADAGSFYVRIGSVFGFSTAFSTTRNAAAVGKQVTLTLPSFVTGNFSASFALNAAGSYINSTDTTATNIRMYADAGANTATAYFYDTAAAGAQYFSFVGFGVIP